MEASEEEDDLESAKEELQKVRKLICKRKRPEPVLKPLESGVSPENGIPIEKDKNER